MSSLEWNCDTLDKVFNQLCILNHIDTFNVSCLEQLANHFQRACRAIELIEEYKDGKERFLIEAWSLNFVKYLAAR